MTTVYSLPVADIRPHPHNPRRDLGDLTELAESIRSQGVLQPVTVVPDPDAPTGYVCLLGHRRHAASVVAGQNLIPADTWGADIEAEQSLSTPLTHDDDEALP
jgi:ParB family chromosome partitioning protein